MLNPFINSPAYTLLAFIFVLGVVIFIHEFGHFLVARLLRIRVDIFSLGFGPRLVGIKRGDTDYRVSALPLGGYVKMAGDDYESLTGGPDEFLSRPKTHRFLVALAGPTMNLFLAVALLAVNFNLGVEIPSYFKEPFVIEDVEKDSPADQAGLKFKDKIIKIDGKPVPTFEDAVMIIAMSANQKLDFTLERDGQLFEKEITPRMVPEQGTGRIGATPFISSIIEVLAPDSPADRAGLKKGDEVIQAKSKDTVARSHFRIMELISKSEGVPLEFTVRRGNQILEKQITPLKINNRVTIGLNRSVIVEKYGLLASIENAVKENYKTSVMTFKFLGRVIRGKGTIKAFSGPIGIAMISGEAARAGREFFLGFISQLSLNLGTLNLLPIPILDGGVIFLLLVEGLIRREISIQVKERIVQFGFIFIVLLMGVIIVNDISKISAFSRFFK